LVSSIGDLINPSRPLFLLAWYIFSKTVLNHPCRLEGYTVVVLPYGLGKPHVTAVIHNHGDLQNIEQLSLLPLPKGTVPQEMVAEVRP
jgi:hypothetical protein